MRRIQGFHRFYLSEQLFKQEGALELAQRADNIINRLEPT